jgi:hypothetical protein
VGIAAVEIIVKENRRVTVNETAARLDMIRGSDIFGIPQIINKLINI